MYPSMFGATHGAIDAVADRPLRITVLGLTITSSWGNGHATTYRGLLHALADRGHEVTFLERDVPWYAANRDLPKTTFAPIFLYRDLPQLRTQFRREVAEADLVMVGSFVPEGAEVGRWVLDLAGGRVAFYDIDTPITLADLALGRCEYLAPDLIPRYDLYLSFTGGPVLEELEKHWGARVARPLYCSVDPAIYFPQPVKTAFELGYMGTYSEDRQPKLERCLLDVARHLPDRPFIVAGPQYPNEVRWPTNVEHLAHLAPEKHRAFYNRQRFTLNITRAAMSERGFSPSVRLFEAAACGVPVISDWWEGLDTFFIPDEEILIAETTEDVLRVLRDLSEDERLRIGEAARRRVFDEHTPQRRAATLEHYVERLQAGPVSAPEPAGAGMRPDY